MTSWGNGITKKCQWFFRVISSLECLNELNVTNREVIVKMNDRERHSTETARKDMQNCRKRAMDFFVKISRWRIFVSWYWCNIILHIHAYSLRCLFFILRCLSSVWDVFCSLLRQRQVLPLKRMSTKFVEGQSVDTHFCQWLVSISLYSTIRKK